MTGFFLDVNVLVALMRPVVGRITRSGSADLRLLHVGDG